MRELAGVLSGLGLEAGRIHTEIFGAAPAMTPGVVATPAVPPHPPDRGARHRSGGRLRAQRSQRAMGLPRTRACSSWPRRAACPCAGRVGPGVCHNCESGLLSGAVTYAPDPVEPPADGNVLICCSIPREDIVLDL